MIADDRLAVPAAELRRAVAEGRYADAERLLPAYTHAVAQLHNAEAAAEAGDLIEWARKLALARKAEIAAQVASLPAKRCGYVSRPVRPAHTWELEG
jgi:hypothetical protein